ncbi:Protein W05H9.4 [Corchorus olitorius]|uniref:Protein W05H9.4 n=1 Tax=Corchorus olitorius TaxID=93759 RepID=A0A1R3GYC5_9ROSI|nr:Protein W05H9.4 [Corchorus olitorius]
MGVYKLSPKKPKIDHRSIPPKHRRLESTPLIGHLVTESTGVGYVSDGE